MDTNKQVTLIRQLPEKYMLVQSEEEFSALTELTGVKTNYTHGFVLTGNGEVLGLWGYAGSIPYLSKLVYRLF